MKRLKEVPPSALKIIESERDAELAKVFKSYIRYASLPVRPVRMRILRDGESNFEQTIVPATTIYIRSDGFLDKEFINRDALTYSVTNTAAPFPYGHIYQGSGHVCLGSIFVPAKVSRFCPQQPLETLFLHNDRNTGHGDAKLSISVKVMQNIEDILKRHNILLLPGTHSALNHHLNVIKTDGLWLLGADVYRQSPNLLEALRIMNHIYKQIFESRTEGKKWQ